MKRGRPVRRDPDMRKGRTKVPSVAAGHGFVTRVRTKRTPPRALTKPPRAMSSSDELSWDRDGRDWPNRDASRFVRATGMRWHVQQMGSGPTLLMLHGTGASTHSWRTLAPLLARSFTVVAPDLPGHSFTESPARGRLSLPGMARQIGEVLHTLAIDPAMAVGHSAGAAIMLRMALDGAIAPRAMVSLNGALLPFGGAVSQFFSPLARLLVLNPLVPHLFAWRASKRSAVQRLILNTGSTIDDGGIEFYGRLVSSPRHVAAALAMMANWDLEPLVRDLPKLQIPLLLVACGGDRAISSDQAFRVRERMPSAKVEYVRGLGHLAHEERPDQFAEIITKWARSSGVLPDA
jgi:magnesium chelatase accessory protein